MRRLHHEPRPEPYGEFAKSGPRAASSAPGMPPRWEGWDDAAVAAAEPGCLLARSSGAARTSTLPGGLLRPFRSRLHPHAGRASTCKARRASEASREFVERAADLVVRYGGSMSGEHGDGQSRGALLPKMFGPELMQALREFKAVWDPDATMNPGKLVDAYPADRESAAWRRLQAARSADALHVSRTTTDRSPKRRFAASASANAASTTTGRCVRATWRRSRRSTARGAVRACCSRCCRARCLPTPGTTSHVKRSLDLCLSCKACKSECPDERRHRDLPLGIPVALLREPRPAARGVRVRLDRSLGAAGSVLPRLANAAARAPRRLPADAPRSSPRGGT